MTQRQSNVVVLLCAVVLCTGQAFATPAQDPLCRYVFNNTAKASDGSGHYPEMRLSRGTPEPGSVKTGIRLDDASMSTKEIILTNAFTVNVWVRPMAFGRKAVTRDWPNGMIVNCGSGYYDGWRILVQDTHHFRPVFEIGRKEGSVSVTSGKGLTTSTWHMVSATWTPDASSGLGTMRLFLDGELAAESKANTPPPLPPNAPLSVGYTDFGVGSMLMDFGELSIFNRTLTPEQISTLFISREFDQDLASEFDRAEWLGTRAMVRMAHTGKAAREWSAIAQYDEFDVIHRIFAAIRARDSATLRTLLQRPDTPEFLKMRHEIGGFTKQACTFSRAPDDSLPRKRIFISPSGLDTGKGTESSPFSTLERARDEIRRLRKEGYKGNIAVILGGGRYGRTTPFVLDTNDSANGESKVIVAAKPGDPQVVLDGGIRIGQADFRKVTDKAVLAVVPEEARDRILVADVNTTGRPLPPHRSFGVGEATRSVMMLTANDTHLMHPARWPNAGFITSSNIIDGTGCIIGIDPDRAARWAGAVVAMAHGYWMYTWADAALPVAVIQTNGIAAIKLLKPHSYGLGKAPSFYVCNLIEELDAPGEWFYDGITSKLYMIPPEGVQPEFVTLTALDNPFIEIHGANRIEFRGISFRNARSDAIRIRNSHDVTFSLCDFQSIGGSAIDGTGCEGLIVRDSSFRNLGHSGIMADAGDRRTLRPGNVRIHHNTFARVGQFARTYTPGTLVSGVGAVICHNEFSDMPSSAMRIEGNEHIIECNDVHDVVMESDDQGAVDMWGDPSFRRCIFRYNTFRNIGNPAGAPCGQCAIRFDDMISGMIVHDNIFENVSRANFGAVQIHGGSHNIICLNTIRDCKIGVSFSPWGEKRWKQKLSENQEIINKIHKNVEITQPPYSTRYPELSSILQDVDRNFIWDNLLIRCGQSYQNLPPQTQTIWNTVERQQATPW